MKLRELAVYLDMYVSWDGTNVIVDTTRSYEYEPFIPQKYESETQIGHVYRAPVPIFIDDMPIFSYALKMDTSDLPSTSEEQMMRSVKYPFLENVYILLNDLQNYSFDLKHTDDAIYVERNEEKTYNLLPGDLINITYSNEIKFTLYKKKVKLILNGKEINGFSTGTDYLISVNELFKDSIAIQTYETSRKNMNFRFRGKKLQQGLRDGKDGVMTKSKSFEGDYSFMGYGLDGKKNGYGEMVRSYTPFGNGGASSTWYYSYSYGYFRDDVFVSGVYYSTGHYFGLTSPSGPSYKVGLRLDGDMKNGYIRKSIVTDNTIYSINKDINDERFFFGYRVVCEGDITDGNFSGGFMSFDKDGYIEYVGLYEKYDGKQRFDVESEEYRTHSLRD